MRQLRRIASAAVVAMAAVALGAGVPADPATAGATRPYRMVDLGTLGGESSYATALNDRGEVVGSSQVADGSYHGFRWRRGVMTDLGDLRPVDINNRGQIVGTVDVLGGTRAVLWGKGRRTDLGTLGGASSFPTAINDRGNVVGTSDTATGPSRPFLWTGRRMRQLPLNDVSGINNRDQIAGGALVGAGFHAVLWRRGKLTDLGAQAFDRSNTYGINDRGWVIGWVFSPEQRERGILWRRGVMTDLGTLGGATTHLVAVNNRGQILGTSQLANGFVHPILWRCGVMTDLTTGGVAADVDLAGLNNRGQIAASIRPVFGISRAVLYR